MLGTGRRVTSELVPVRPDPLVVRLIIWPGLDLALEAEVGGTSSRKRPAAFRLVGCSQLSRCPLSGTCCLTPDNNPAGSR